MRIGRLLVVSLVSLGLVLALLGVLGGHHIRALVRGDGRCWARVSGDTTDYVAVQAAVDAAGDGAVVKVAGHCVGVGERGGMAQTVYISKPITIRGGYTVTNWITPDLTANPTVLDAEGQGRVLVIAGPPRGTGERLNVTLEGLEITGGDASGLGGGRLGGDVGGGIYGWNARCTVSSTHIAENRAQRGGGLYLYNGEVDLISNSVSNNSVEWTGGGLYLDEMSGVKLEGNAILGNTADWDGGGVYIRGCTATLEANRLTTNAALQSGGGLYLRFSRAVLKGNDVARGKADQNGGGVYLDRNALITMTDSTIAGNLAGVDGGGVYIDESKAWLSRNRFIANTAVQGGGGLHMLETDAAVVVNSVIGDNSGREGSGVHLDTSFAEFIHTTIVSSALGSGVYVDEHSTVVLTNTILVSHTTDLHVAQGGRAVLEATLWSGDPRTEVGLYDGEGTIVTGTRNYWGNPDFVNPGISDYHIGFRSTAINKGVSSGVLDDIDGALRPADSAIDLGADEIWQTYLPFLFRQ